MSWNVIRPIGARVLIKLDRQRTHYGAIEIPDDCREQQETGVVLAVGTDAGDTLKVGDRVITGKWNGVACPAPANDPSGEGLYWFLRVPKSSDRGTKLPVRVHGRTHQPVADELYAVVEMSEDEAVEAMGRKMPKRKKAARDLPRARFSQR